MHETTGVRTGPATPPAAEPTRRVRRAASPAAARRPAHDPRASTRPAPRRAASRVVLSAVVMTFAAGLVATLALPSYAFDPSDDGSQTQIADRKVAADGEQQFQAAADLSTAELQRDGFKATSDATLLRRAFAQQFSAYSGPTAQDYLKNPAHPSFSLDAVFSTALQYRGTPYVFGGADPSGFDCSGFIMFVYAQYGIALPHSVHAQDAIGQTISPEDAQPGDVVVFNNGAHDGFYAGDGMILHAPYPGAQVRVQPIWTNAVHFVRFGI